MVYLSPDALASLSLLLSRPMLEAGDYIELPRAGELLRVIEDFFRTHFQRFRGLRSLEVLRGLEAPAPPEPEVGPKSGTLPPGRA